MKENKRLNKGITLIALIVTIVIMLILAGVTINVTVDGGLFGKAQSAKNSMEKTQDREKITKAIIYAKEKDRSGKLTVENLQKELSEAKVFEEAGTIIVKLNGTYYEVGENGKIEMLDVTGEKTLTIICKDSTGKEIAKKEYTILKSKYSVTPPEVDDYESLEEKLEGEISESTEITLTYYKILDDDTELVFTGLNSSGAVTAVESEIVSYMVGDGTSIDGNGLKKKDIQAIIQPPKRYKEKEITKIGIRAFYGCQKIVKVDLSNSVLKIEERAFAACSNIKEVVLGDYVQTIDTAAFKACNNIKKIIFGKNINNLQSDVFSECYSISQIIYRNETELISGNLGGIKTSKWVEIEVNDDNKTYKVLDNKLYSKDMKVLIRVPTGISGEISIDNETIKINKYAFYFCDNITKIDVGNKVCEIGERAFAGSNKLEEVRLGDSVHTIGNSAFKDCVNILKIVIGKDVKDIDTNAFNGCKKLSTVTIDSSSIAELITSKTSAAYLINYATTIYIKNNITNIGSYITDNFTTETSDKDGYIKYVKNS